MFKSAGLVLALTAGVAGGIAGYLALAAPPAADKVTGDTSAARAIWTEVSWPFPLDQWGTGRAFACKAADCGADLKLYLRAKLGACNCAAGVADDDEPFHVRRDRVRAQKSMCANGQLISPAPAPPNAIRVCCSETP